MLPGSSHRTANPLTNNGSTSSLTSNPNISSFKIVENSPHERLIASLVSRIESQLPHISGSTIVQLETNSTAQHTAETLIELAKTKPDQVAWSLSKLILGIIEAFPSIGLDSSLQVAEQIMYLSSVLYVLKILCVAMARHWASCADDFRPRGSKKRTQPKPPWVDPPPMNEGVADYILRVMVHVLRRIHVPIARPRVAGHSRVGSFPDFESINLEGGRTNLLQTHKTLFPLTSQNFDDLLSSMETNTEHNSGATTRHTPQAAYVITMSSFHLSPSPVSYQWLVQTHAARVVFQLSCSNWPVVLANIRRKIHYLAAWPSEPQDSAQEPKGPLDSIDINILQYIAPSLSKLVAVMHELTSLLVNMNDEAREAVAWALRYAIQNWSRIQPQEAHGVVSQRLRFDGYAERLYDQYLATTKREGPSKASYIWPVLVPLLAISPDRLAQYIAEAIDDGAQQSNLVVILSSHLLRPPTQITEVALGCLMDFCKSAAYLTPDLQNSGIYSYSQDIANDLHRYFFENGQTPDRSFLNWRGRISIPLQCDLLFVLYSFLPQKGQNALRLCLSPGRTTAVHLCAVDALLTIASETKKHRWGTPMETLFQYASLIRRVFSTTIHEYTRQDPYAPLSDTSWGKPILDDWAIDPTLTERENLILGILMLIRIDYRLFYDGLTETNTLPESIAALYRPQVHQTLRASAAKTSMSILTAITSSEVPQYFKLISSMGPQISKTIITCILEQSKTLPLSDSLNLRFIHHVIGFHVLLNGDDSAQGLRVWKAMDGVCPSAEILALLHLASFQQENLHLIAEILALVKQVEPAGTLSSDYQLSHKHRAERRLAYAEMMECMKSDASPQAQQEHMRAIIRKLTFPFPLLAITWREVHRRWRDSTILSHNESRNMHRGTTEEASGAHLEWRNFTFYLTATLSSCATPSTDSNSISNSKITLQDVLPAGLRVDESIHDVTTTFIEELVEKLRSTNAFVRETALEALCSELNPSLYPHFLSVLDGRISAVFHQHESPPWDEPYKTYAMQFTLLLKSVLDRANSSSGKITEYFDLVKTIQCLVRFIDLAPNNVFAFRIRTNFVNMIESLLVDPERLKPRNDTILRNVLLMFISGWTSHSIEYQAIQSQGHHEIIHELDIACLRCLATITSTVTLQPVEDTTSALDTLRVRARLFQRQLSFYMVVIERWLRNQQLDHAEIDPYSLITCMKPEQSELVWKYSVEGISNLLAHNTHAGLSLALRFCYHEEPQIRALFLAVFSNFLERSADLRSADVSSLMLRHSYLCESLKTREILLALSIIEHCPETEKDEKCQMLLNVFNTRGSLMKLLKAVIDQEVENTDAKASPFRTNEMRNRLLSSFCRKYGLPYLQHILASFRDYMVDHPEQSYEIDPNKASPSDNTSANIEHVRFISQQLLTHILNSIEVLPTMIRELCAHIATRVYVHYLRNYRSLDVLNATKRTRKEAYGDDTEAIPQAIGAFLFLRFICPAIIQPESVGLDVPMSMLNVRSGLMLVTKIIQALANNAQLGKYAAMAVFNPFLKENIAAVTRFLKHVSIPTVASSNLDEIVNVSYEEVDHMILHHFFNLHVGIVGTELLRYKGVFAPRRNAARVQETKSDFDELCSILVDLGSHTKYPSLTAKSGTEHPRYGEFLFRNAARNTDSVENIFYELNTGSQRRKTSFMFHISDVDVELVEGHVLSVHMFRLLSYGSNDVEIVVDFSKFTSASDIPVPWITDFFDVIPYEVFSRLKKVHILNTNRAAQSFLRKAAHIFMGFSYTATVNAFVSTSVDFKREYPNHPRPAEELFKFKTGVHSEFDNVELYDELHRPFGAQLRFEAHHIRLTTNEREPVFGAVKSQIVEFINYEHIHDVVTSRDKITVQRGDELILISTPKFDEIIKAIRIAKAGFNLVDSDKPLMTKIIVGDTNASLIYLGLLNCTHPTASVRNSAHRLVCAVMEKIGYKDSSLIQARNADLPAHPSIFAIPLSEKLAKFAPNLTLDVISEFSRGYRKSTTVLRGSFTKKYSSMHAPESEFHEAAPGQIKAAERTDKDRSETVRWQRMTGILLVSPWTRNLHIYADPSKKDNFDPTGETLRSAIRNLIALTVQDAELTRALQVFVWSEIGKNDAQLVSGLVIDELIKAATYVDFDSYNCTVIAGIVTMLPSIGVRARLFSQMRQTLAKLTGTGEKSEDDPWNDIGALAKLCSAAMHNSQFPVHSQLLVPEVCHTISMLGGIGRPSLRRATSGLLVNFIEALRASRIGDVEEAELKELYKFCNSPEVLRMFRLARVAVDSDEYRDIESTDENDAIEATEGICSILLKAIDLAAPTTGLANVWRGRWMSLTTTSAFGASPLTQYRAFVIMGSLCPASIDDDFLYQLLVVFRRDLPHLQSLAGIVRCIHKMTPGLTHTSRGPPLMLWLAVSLVQTGVSVLFPEAVRLLQGSIETLKTLDQYKHTSLRLTFAVTRQPLDNSLNAMDSVVGLSTEGDFSISLAASIFRGMRASATKRSACDLLQSLLHLSMLTGSPHSSRPPLQPVDRHALGFFLALLPTCTDADSLRDLARASGAGKAWIPGEPSGSLNPLRLPLEVLGINNEMTALMVMTFIIGLLNTAKDDRETAMLFVLLEEASIKYPKLMGLTLDMGLERISAAFKSTSNNVVLEAASSICIVAKETEKAAPLNPRSPKSFQPSGISQEHLEQLRTINMHGMLNCFHGLTDEYAVKFNDKNEPVVVSHPWLPRIIRDVVACY